ncbi:MAG: glycosyltransferase family 4 protein, partial [Candidatus Omnitrophica bacterium]|nr:glycosyltransferase family 4 protein [Candidatus Omnitrophota bacterium]
MIPPPLSSATGSPSEASPKGTLLFPTYNFPPLGRGGALMKYHIARVLAELGWTLEVLTTDIPRGTLIRQVADTSIAKEPVVGMNIHRCRATGLGLPGELLYLAGVWVCPQYPWARAWRKNLDRVPPGSAVLASFPPASNLILGEWLSDELECPLFLDFRDEFSGTQSAEKGKRWLQKARDLETRVVTKAVCSFVTSETVAEHLRARYGLAEERVVVVENGIFAPQEEADRVSEARFARPKQGNDPLRLLWLGTLSQHQKPSTLLEGFRLWQERNSGQGREAKLTLVCHSSLYFQRKIKPLLGRGIEWIPFVPRDRIPELVAGADIGCLSL